MGRVWRWRQQGEYRTCPNGAHRAVTALRKATAISTISGCEGITLHAGIAVDSRGGCQPPREIRSV